MSVLLLHSSALGTVNSRNDGRKGLVGRFAASLAREWQNYRAARAVESLSDAMLHDIGIPRSEIDHAVRHGRTNEL